MENVQNLDCLLLDEVRDDIGGAIIPILASPLRVLAVRGV